MPEVGATRCFGYEVRWTESGPLDAPMVLLLHGLYAGADSYEWRELVPLLSVSFRVRVPDLLGTGTSDRPDLEFTRPIVQEIVDALIADAGPDAVVLASSLTGAYAVRSVAAGAAVRSLVLITPTGLGLPREQSSHPVAGVLYALARRTPVGDLLIAALTSRPSVRWFQTHKTYRDPTFLDDAELDETRRAGRLPNAKQLQLAFVFGRLAIDLAPADVDRVHPTVIWGRGQAFVDDDELDRWRMAHADIIALESGLPQVEEPERVVQVISRLDLVR